MSQRSARSRRKPAEPILNGACGFSAFATFGISGHFGPLCCTEMGQSARLANAVTGSGGHGEGPTLCEALANQDVVLRITYGRSSVNPPFFKAPVWSLKRTPNFGAAQPPKVVPMLTSVLSPPTVAASL
jgi:hypothetical protein